MIDAPQIEYDLELESQEAFLAEEDESDETPPSDIVAFNELRSCSDLNRLHVAGQLEIQPDFQREDVWQASQQTRFIDSLAKQLPIPSMCISLDYKSDQRQIVDGLQRMTSIIRFLGEPKWRLSNLDDVDARIANKTVEYIKENTPEIYNRVENTVIPVTVLRCDLSKRSHQEYLFTIFHRLNTGGMKLNNQEIRNCIYSGKFNQMLKDVVWSEISMQLFGLTKDKKYRFSNEELLLRVIALSEDYKSYKKPLSKFLNGYMSKQRKASDEEVSKKKTELFRTIEATYNKALSGEPFPRLSKATIEGVLVGILSNIDDIEAMDDRKVAERYQTLRNHEAYSLDALKEGLADATRVNERLDAAIGIFAV